MKNREQIRARNALAASSDPIHGKEGGDVVKKIPALIMNHGVLAVGAYAFSNKGFEKIFDYIARHLADRDIGLVPEGIDTAQRLMEYLTGDDADSTTLRLVTAETMAWLAYARRFIKKS